MNHCRRCDSDYEKPGTCNCFADEPPKQVVPTYPALHPIWVVPVQVYNPPPFYPYTTSGTIAVYEDEMQRLRDTGQLSYTDVDGTWWFHASTVSEGSSPYIYQSGTQMMGGADA